MPTKLVSVGFIARHKTIPGLFAGHGCRAKLYSGPGLARRGALSGYHPDSNNEAAWEILEVFVKEDQ